MHRLHCLLLLGALALSGLLGAGCRSAPAGKGSGKTVAARESERAQENALHRRGRAHAHYAAGVIHDLNDEQELALQEFFKAAQDDPEDETLVLEVSRRLLQGKQPEKALELLLPAAARPGASGAIFARLGLVYTRLGQNEKAIEANRLAVQKTPGSLAGYQNLFLNYLQTKQPEAALKVLGDAASQPGADAEFLIGIAELYSSYALQFPSQREAVHAKAKEVLQRAETLPLRTAQLRLRLADGYNMVGASDDAARNYLSLLSHIGDLPLMRDAVRARLTDIYIRGRDRKRAAEQLEAVVRDDPSNAQAYYFLGSIAYDDKRWADAVGYLQKAILFSPELEQAYYDLAAAQLAMDNAQGALDTLAAARRKFPPGFITEYLQGMACTRKKDYTQAVAHFTTAEVVAQVTDTNRLTPAFFFQVGAACERKGDRVQAEHYFKKCLTMKPDFAEAQNYLGYMWAERGENLEEARELIEKAVKAEPENAAFLDSLGWVLFKQNQPKDALDHILKAVKLNEEPDATLYDHLGDVYAALNEMDKAREAWGKSLKVEESEAVRKKLGEPKTE